MRDANRESCVIVRLVGGLGNQLFEYTAGLELAERLGRNLYLDTSWFDWHQVHKPFRQLKLFWFRLRHRGEYATGTRRMLIGFGAVNSRWIRWCMRPVLLSLGVRPVHERHPRQPDPAFDRPPSAPRILLNGYWQTHDHFLAVRAKLQEQVVPATALTSAAQEWVREIEAPGSVFVHVRRGDYSKFGSLMLTPEFYRQAGQLIREAIPRPRWFLFSEDQDWCRQNLGFLENPRYVALKGKQADCEELWLMSRCGGGILANSTFSWWGAALGERPDRPIVGPRRLACGPGPDTAELMLPGWLALDAC